MMQLRLAYYYSIALGLIATPVIAQSAENGGAYQPPKSAVELLGKDRFAGAKPIDESYRTEFMACDGLKQGAKPDIFESVKLYGIYKCSTDPSHVSALLSLTDGAVMWQAKMALDVDGSWAALHGAGGTTDQCGTELKWHSPRREDCKEPDNQIDPDRFPYVVIPRDGLKRFAPTNLAAERGAEFRNKTHLDFGDLGIVVHGDSWSPAFIGDGGPFMRLGEASTRVFENLGSSRCKKWNQSGDRCVGNNPRKSPYIDRGIGDADVIYIFYPGSRPKALGPDSVLAEACKLAEVKLGLKNGKGCPSSDGNAKHETTSVLSR